MRRRVPLRSAAVSVLALGGSCALCCQEDGVNSSCPQLPLYDNRSPAGDAGGPSGDTAEVRAALARAADAGCITRTTTFESAEAGTAGMAGADDGMVGTDDGMAGADDGMAGAAGPP